MAKVNVISYDDYIGSNSTSSSSSSKSTGIKGNVISYEDYVGSNKAITSSNMSPLKSPKQQKEDEAKQTYEETKKAADKIQTEIKQRKNTLVNTALDKAGIKAPERLTFSTNPSPTFVRNEKGTTTIKSQYDKNQEQAKEYQKRIKVTSNLAKNDNEYKALTNLYKQVNNEKVLAKYNYDLAKEDNHNINLYDKTLGVPMRAIGDFFNSNIFSTEDNAYYGENGTYYLPTANQIRQENVGNSYGDDIFGKVAKFGTDVGYNVTKIGISTGLNALAGGIPIGSAAYFYDMGLDSLNSAMQQGYDGDSAATYAVVNVVSEMATEKLLGGISDQLKLTKGGSKLSKALNKAVGTVFKNDSIRNVLSNAMSEGIEEFVQEYVEKFSQNLILEQKNLGKSAKDTFTEETFRDAIYSTLVGMGSGGLMSAGKTSINTNNTGVIPTVDKNGNINVDSYTNQLQNALNNAKNQNQINNINQAIDYMNLSKATGNNEINAQTMNNNIRVLAPTLNEVSGLLNTKNTRTINEDVLPSKENQVVLPRAKEAEDNTYQYEDFGRRLQEAEKNNRYMELSPDNEMLNPKNETAVENKINRLQYAPTSNEKVNNLYNTASKYFNNTEQTSNLMNTLSKIVKDKGYNIVFDDTNMQSSKGLINGKIETKNGETTITLNPNSPRAFEFVAVHEITHAIETSSMKNMILSYAKKNGDFNTALDSLKRTYGTNDVSSEVIADISGQLLGNQEFINNLSMEKPGLFKHLYNEIKAFYHKMRGWKTQDQFVEDLMNKWEYAYATQQNNLNNKSYSMQDNKVVKTNDLNEYIADAAVREAQQTEFNKQSIRKNIEDYIEENNIKNPTIEDMMNSMDDYNMMDNEVDITELNKAQKLYKQVAEDLYNDKYSSKVAKMNDLSYNNTRTNLDLSTAQPGDLKNEFYDSLTPKQWRKYHNKMNKVMDSTYSDLNRTDVIDGKLVSTEIKNHTEQVVDVFKISKEYQNKISFLIEEANNYGYSGQELQNISEEMFGKENVFRYDTSSGKFIRISELEQNSNRVNGNNRYNVREGIEGKNFKNNKELDNSSFSLQEKTNYRGSHQIENAKSITEINLNDVESKVTEANGYLSKQDTSDLNKLKRIVNNPNEMVKIYRASPVNELNSGDWVTTDRAYAKNVADNNGGKVYTYEVKAEQLYYPDNVNDLPSLHRLSSFQYVDNTDTTTHYSTNNKTWQQYLEENYISRGTKTYGKNIRTQNENNNKASDHYVIKKVLDKNMEKSLKGDNVLKNQQVDTNDIGNLTKAELTELETLKSVRDGGFANDEEIKRIDYLENKRDGLIKFPELKQKVEFKDISKEYTKFKNNIGEFNPKLLNQAEDTVKGYRNTKTKQQWLDVAENIGLHFKGDSQALTDYAVQSWFETQPNNKNSLNREGKGYVKFSIEEWVNSIYKGAGVGEKIARPTVNTTSEVKINTNTNIKNYTSSDIDNMFQFSDNDNRTIALPDEVGERLATKTNMTPIEVGRLQTIIDSATDTKVNGNQLEISSDYDNNIYTIKATKHGDTYVIDDVTKGVKNSLGSVANIETTTNDNVESVDTKRSISENNIDENIAELNNKMQAETNKSKDTRTEYKETVEKGTNLKESKFYKNATETSKFITEDNRAKLSEVGDLKYYESVSNEESLNKASKRLKEYGTTEAVRWMQQDNKTSSATDVAEGWILLKNYQDAGDYNSMVAVAKKMRQMGTVAGQTVQAYNIMARLTPEGMVKYAQSELSEAYDVYAKNKSKAWVDKNASKFDLNAQEVGFIVDTMKQVEGMEDGRAKNVKLGEINKMLTDKLPPDRGAGIKAWMRISMLFNPKTQVRNVMGNAIITPVNMVGDFFAAAADKYIAKKTGTRTTGNTDIKNYLKGFKKGLYESYDDFKRGINTHNIDANRFELGQAKSFNENTKLGKALNKVDTLNSFLLDAGDRGFYEASFTNSINNQLALNNTTKVTQDMIDIATSEALQRTWQDNNNYTKFVLTTRNMLNKANVKGYGLGDLLIPFAKTPANLTKAIVDYSPAGMVNAIIQAKNLKNNISTGTNTAIQQHQFVQTLGKATAGTMLYVAAYGLAKAGIATGQSDDDKDTRDFIKNTLGVSSYSIKIGDKSFTYDWAQPVAAPLSIMTNVVNSKNNKGQALLESITSSLDSAGSILLEQSFLKSINEVLTDNDGIVSGIENAMLDLPTRAVPTFMKQIVDMTDGTQRQTFEYNQPLKTAINKVKAKIPGLSQTLSPSVDTMGREIQKYGGKNNIFNVFINPANVNTSNISEAAQEIYRVYKEVGDNTIMPRVAPYYINSKGEKTILNTEQRKNFQSIAGNVIEKNINELKNNKSYASMSDSEKSDVIKNVVDYAYNKARKEVLGMEMANTYNKVNEWVDKGGTVASYYANKEETDYSLKNPTRYATIKNMGVDYYDYEKYQKEVNAIKDKYSGTKNSTIRKQKVFEYINSLKLSANQKVILFKMLGNYSIKDFSSQTYQYINSFNISAKEKQEIWNTLF